ncbi:glycerate kinase [Candidatus Peregrinibacteria bacterium CG22_combo_CG10-13_8_21_14_all_44_10]|nr:MAG: hypothetical protein AUK45_04740 [Candidatus Peregrinibacteria bacterium CG2_30_44_17]PIP66332.1 MAG: glycerate kinase [Candidatus Peregrinibacteria bacterium CG22_combo_CG10-13_8_21_14_all_44_10]PIS03740.1 MAG: glycerate kinase [Candidatus Peregrinibacteria bacterium CG10_big_fil_rev_8_21_14_0_10_44_7]PIX80475.1 MAG: glycerate kinase [Candidatus Peregrinibacteria bacterium CG_4_10_14_3_um_filter_44_21]PJB89095.1 MAG: glycerate kinase [Candidatus Peregrinibacteria bacterium CG_4_9_14_0_
MIKNKTSLLRGLPKEEKESRKLLLDITEAVLANIDPDKLVRSAMPKTQGYKNIYVIGTGKGAAKMAQAIEKTTNVSGGFITIPKGEQKPNLKKIKYGYATHPLPSQTGVRGAAKILKIAQKAGAKDLVIAVISGGGSALMPLPIEGISLQTKITITKKLLKSGATIQEINTVRKHLSKIKGGHLARAVYPAKCIQLVISDVLGDDLSAIASGPLAPDITTIADAIKVLSKYKIKAPKTWLETEKPDSEVFKKITTKILANHETVSREAAKETQKRGFKPVILDASLDGECRKRAKELSKKPKNKKSIYIATGETTVNVRGNGAGGRNQEFVLATIKDTHDLTVLSIGTDGVDGICPRKTAGAIASQSTSRQDIANYLKNNDSYHFFQKSGGLIKTGPTGTNLGDLILMQRT